MWTSLLPLPCGQVASLKRGSTRACINLRMMSKLICLSPAALALQQELQVTASICKLFRCQATRTRLCCFCPIFRAEPGHIDHDCGNETPKMWPPSLCEMSTGSGMERLDCLPLVATPHAAVLQQMPALRLRSPWHPFASRPIATAGYPRKEAEGP